MSTRSGERTRRASDSFNLAFIDATTAAYCSSDASAHSIDPQVWQGL
jgi:hypothetical protein